MATYAYKDDFFVRIILSPSFFKRTAFIDSTEQEIEHTICKIKKFGIMGTKFRNRLKRYNNASDIVSGLVNLRVMQSNRISL